MNLHSLTTKTRTKLIAPYSPLLLVQIITEKQSISVQSKVNNSEIKAIMDFLHGTLQRGPKGPQDNINSVGLKKILIRFGIYFGFFKNKIIWKIICLSQSFRELVKGLESNISSQCYLHSILLTSLQKHS